MSYDRCRRGPELRHSAVPCRHAKLVGMTLSANDHDYKLSPPWSPGPRTGVALLLLLLPSILLLELTSGQGFSLSVFYLCPIALGAWAFGRSIGFGLAAVSGAYSAFVAFNTLGPHEPLSQFYWQSGSTLAVFLLFAFVVSHHRRFIDVVVAHGRIDVESGAVSRREFENVLRSETSRALRYERPFALMLVEAVAAKEGTLTPSRLESLVATMRQNVHESDCIARLGEGKFALLLVEHTLEDANGAGAMIAGALRARFAGRVGIHAGVVGYMGRGSVSPNKLMLAANDQLRLDANSPSSTIAGAVLV